MACRLSPWPAVPRRPGIRLVQADVSAPASMDGVFSGVKSMFLLTGNHPDMSRLQITADRGSWGGVEHVVKLSALGAFDHAKLPIRRAITKQKQH